MSTVTLTLSMTALVATGVALYFAPVAYCIIEERRTLHWWAWVFVPIWPGIVAGFFVFFLVRHWIRGRKDSGIESPAEQVAESMRKQS